MSKRKTTTAEAVDAVLRVTLAAQSIQTKLSRKRMKELSNRVGNGYVLLHQKDAVERLIASNDLRKDLRLNVDEAINLGFAIPKDAPQAEGKFIVQLWKKILHRHHRESVKRAN